MSKAQLKVLKSFIYSHSGVRWLMLDFLVGFFAYPLALVFDSVRWPEGHYGKPEFLLSVFCALTVTVMSRLTGIPRPGYDFQISRYDILSTGFIAAISSTITFCFILLWFPGAAVGRGLLAIAVIVIIAGTGIPRIVLNKLLKKYLAVRVIIIGCDATALHFYEKISVESDWQVVGYCSIHGDESKLRDIPSFELDELLVMNKEDIDVLVVCDEREFDFATQGRLLELPLHGIDVLSKGAFLDKYFKEISLDFMSFHWLTSFSALSADSAVFFSKRILDLLVAFVALIGSLPFWLIMAFIIKIGDGGSVFYSQTRVGRFGRHFTIYKFRTMRMNAEINGAQWAQIEDERITFFGKIFRKTRLDELPQLLNVLRGDMSLVGPRPERPEIEELLKKELRFYERRHLVPPGLTGWAQINHGYGSTLNDSKRKLEYDLYYIKHLSFIFDLKVIMRTIPLIMKGSR